MLEPDEIPQKPWKVVRFNRMIGIVDVKYNVIVPLTLELNKVTADFIVDLVNSTGY
jgi:hypothetical protein